jgi:hypothetical protein
VVGDWGEVVTRYPYRKVGMDHLLSRSLTSFCWSLQVKPWSFIFRSLTAPQFSVGDHWKLLFDNLIVEQAIFSILGV